LGFRDFAWRKLPMHQCFLISPPRRRVQPGSAMALGPGAAAACPTGCCHSLPAPDLPQRGKAQSLNGEEEEGRLLPPAFLPRGGLHVLPCRRQGGEDASPRQDSS